MGNESSLPSDASGSPSAQQDGIESDNQGRASLSTTTAASSNQHHQQQIPGTQQQSTSPTSAFSNASHERRPGERSARAGARMIGAVFGKGVRTATGVINQHNAASPPMPEQEEGREKSARPAKNNAVDSSELPSHSQSNRTDPDSPDISTANSYNDIATQHSYASSSNNGGPHDLATSHDYYAQSQYHATQQQMNQQQQFHAGQPNPGYHPQSIPYDRSSSMSSQDVNHREHPAVGVMYERPGNPPAQKKSIFPGRATARGAALISSMRNLTLAGALRGGKKEVNDWEKQWDADEDDDSDEEEGEKSRENDASTAGLDASSDSMITATPSDGMPLHQNGQAKPAMDVGYSDLPMQPIPQSDTSHMDSSNEHANYNSITPVNQIPDGYLGSVPNRQQHQDLAAEWDMAGIQPPTAIVDDQETTSITPAAQTQQELAKPNVQMFLPMLRVLGKGSFGKVVLVQKRVGKEKGSLFAMKILRKTHLVKRRQIERTRTERRVLSVVNHPFIMKLHYAFQSHDKLYLVLDYCPGGELFFHLSRFRRFPERVARFYAAELLLAIGHLHKRGIIYRDLKPENVLLDADGHVKLGDFGLAKAGIKHPCEGAMSMCGTPEYMAPEVLAQSGHGFCVDYWGLGMLLYEMMTGLPPWYTTDRAKLFRRLKSAPLDIPSYFSEQAANCVSALLERNPRRRLGVTGIRNSMEHEFFRNISWKSLYARRVEAPVRPCEGWRPPEATPGNDDDRIIGTVGGPLSLTDIEGINRNDLDAATANFDNTFTRMPVESEEMTSESEGMDDAEISEQLTEETFLGFSFDSKDREYHAASHNSSMSISSANSHLSPSGRNFSHSPMPPTAPS